MCNIGDITEVRIKNGTSIEGQKDGIIGASQDNAKGGSDTPFGMARDLWRRVCMSAEKRKHLCSIRCLRSFIEKLGGDV